MTADILFGVFIFYGLVFGLRRGFYKELIAFVGLVLGVAGARSLRDPVGQFIQEKSGMPAGLSHILGTVAAFAIIVVVVNVVLRIALKKVRNPDAENQLGAAGEAAADAAMGDTKMGPVTMFTNPIAKAHTGLIYWSDKLLGGVLGVVKGAAAAYALFAVVYFADMYVDHETTWTFTDSIVESKSVGLYRDHVSTLLRELPEYRVVENFTKTQDLAEKSKGDPNVVEKLALHPAWAEIKATEVFQGVAHDPDVQKLWSTTDAGGKRDVKALLRNAKVRALLTNRGFREAFANANVEQVLKDLAAGNPSGAGTAPPPGAPGTPPAPPANPK